jgi:hypothetical protein
MKPRESMFSNIPGKTNFSNMVNGLVERQDTQKEQPGLKLQRSILMTKNKDSTEQGVGGDTPKDSQTPPLNFVESPFVEEKDAFTFKIHRDVKDMPEIEIERQS